MRLDSKPLGIGKISIFHKQIAFSNSMRLYFLVSVIFFVSSFSPAFAVTSVAAVPTAGEYRIDTEVVTNFGNVGGLEQRVQTDGTTGNVMTTSKAADGAAATTMVKGDKPATWCVKPGAPSDVPRNSPFVCQNTKALANSQLSAVCGASTADSAFRMIDARTWEHTMTVQVHGSRSAATSPASALAMAAPGMSPLQRAESQKAVAGLPSQAQMDSMKADILRQAEEDVKNAKSPKEAEDARKSVQALRQQMNGTAVQRTIQVKERWTLLNTVCFPGH